MIKLIVQNTVHMYYGIYIVLLYNTILCTIHYCLQQFIVQVYSTHELSYDIYIALLYNTILCTIHHCLQYTTLHYSIHLIDSPLLLLLSTHPVKKDPLHQETIPYQQPLDKLKRRPGEEYRVDLFITNSNKRVRVCNQWCSVLSTKQSIHTITRYYFSRSQQA